MTASRAPLFPTAGIQLISCCFPAKRNYFRDAEQPGTECGNPSREHEGYTQGLGFGRVINWEGGSERDDEPVGRK